MQRAPTYNANYQFVSSDTLFWAFSHSWGDKEGGGLSALKPDTNKPPKLVSRAWACGKE